MDLASLIIQLASGAGGGQLAGALFRGNSLGPFGNVLAGAIGGTLGGQILAATLGGGAVGIESASTLDPGMIVAQIAGGGLGGGVLAIVVGLLKRAVGR